MIVRIGRKTKAGWRFEYYNSNTLEEANKFADKKFSTSEHMVQYDESQQNHLSPYSDMFKTVII